MVDTTDPLSAQEAKYLAEIRELQERLEKLKTKVEVIADIRRDSGNPIQSFPRNGATRRNSTGLTQYALEAVKSLNEPTIGNIAECVKLKGYEPRKNFKTSLATTLERLTRRNKIRVEMVGGSKVYRPV